MTRLPYYVMKLYYDMNQELRRERQSVAEELALVKVTDSFHSKFESTLL